MASDRDFHFTQKMLLCLRHPILDKLCRGIDSVVKSCRMLRGVQSDLDASAHYPVRVDDKVPHPMFPNLPHNPHFMLLKRGKNTS